MDCDDWQPPPHGPLVVHARGRHLWPSDPTHYSLSGMLCVIWELTLWYKYSMQTWHSSHWSLLMNRRQSLKHRVFTPHWHGQSAKKISQFWSYFWRFLMSACYNKFCFVDYPCNTSRSTPFSPRLSSLSSRRNDTQIKKLKYTHIEIMSSTKDSSQIKKLISEVLHIAL